MVLVLAAGQLPALLQRRLLLPVHAAADDDDLDAECDCAKQVVPGGDGDGADTYAAVDGGADAAEIATCEVCAD